jgi:hypothetical protein
MIALVARVPLLIVLPIVPQRILRMSTRLSLFCVDIFYIFPSHRLTVCLRVLSFLAWK